MVYAAAKYCVDESHLVFLNIARRSDGDSVYGIESASKIRNEGSSSNYCYTYPGRIRAVQLGTELLAQAAPQLDILPSLGESACKKRL